MKLLFPALALTLGTMGPAFADSNSLQGTWAGQCIDGSITRLDIGETKLNFYVSVFQDMECQSAEVLLESGTDQEYHKTDSMLFLPNINAHGNYRIESGELYLKLMEEDEIQFNRAELDKGKMLTASFDGEPKLTTSSNHGNISVDLEFKVSKSSEESWIDKSIVAEILCEQDSEDFSVIDSATFEESGGNFSLSGILYSTETPYNCSLYLDFQFPHNDRYLPLDEMKLSITD